MPSSTLAGHDCCYIYIYIYKVPRETIYTYHHQGIISHYHVLKGRGEAVHTLDSATGRTALSLIYGVLSSTARCGRYVLLKYIYI